MKRKITIISVVSLALIAVAVVYIAINWNSYDFFIYRLERQLEDKFDITELSGHKYEKYADSDKMYPYYFTSRLMGNASSDEWIYVEYKEEELKLYKSIKKTELGDELAERIKDAFYAKRSTDEVTISCTVMEFDTEEAARSSFQKYTKILKDNYNAKKSSKDTIKDSLWNPYMGLKECDNYIIISKFQIYMDTDYLTCFTSDKYLLFMYFYAIEDSYFHQRYMDLIEKLELPNPTKVVLTKWGA